MPIIDRKMMKIKEERSKMNLLGAVLLVLLVIYLVFLFWPILWAAMSAFKGKYDFLYNKTGIPNPWTWNFGKVFSVFRVRVQNADGNFEYIGMALMYINSFLYSMGCAITQTLCVCLAAYATSRFNFAFSKVLYTTVIVVMIIPIVGSTVSELDIIRSIGWYDTIWGMWLLRANFLGQYFLIMYSVFKGLPMAYTEAAKIDGAGNFSIMTRIIFPLVKSTIMTIVLLHFIGNWNDYQVPLLYMPTHPTIAFGVYYMATVNENDMSSVPMRMTGAMMMLFPVLLVFLLFQKRLMGNLTFGGLKG